MSRMKQILFRFVQLNFSGNANVHQQAFQDLARGERTAAALEHHLTALEKKIEELLAKADEEERIRIEQSKGSQAQPSESSNEDKSTSSS
jgi:hypothetical protein